MAVSSEYRAFVEGQLGRIVRLRSRPMFGGVGFYADDVFFGFLDDDAMYFNVDETTRPRYEARGMTPFLASGETMSSYYRVPDDLIDDPEELRRWTDEAVAAAVRTKGRKKARKKR
jgi:DNA transformation protein